MTLILLRNPVGPSQIGMIRSILKDSPENRVILLSANTLWTDPGNAQIQAVFEGSPFPIISWSDAYALIKDASRLLIPANS